MDVVLLLVLAAAVVALLWHVGRWALRVDSKAKQRDRAKQALIDAAFEDIIKSVRKKRDG